MRPRRIATLLILLTGAAPATRADILHLHDGSRYTGRLISQNSERVVFRVVLSDGVSGLVRSFAADRVRRVERADLPVPRPRKIQPQRTKERRPALEDREHFEQMLREAYELLDDGDRSAAVRALQRLVLRAPPQLRATLAEQCRKDRGVGLAELLAATRLQHAIATSRGRIPRIRFATDYEAAPLADLLIELEQSHLTRIVDGRSIDAWSDDPGSYDTLTEQTPALVHSARFAAAMMSIRMRLDPGIAADPESRQALHHRRVRLSRFVSAVRRLPGFTALRAENADTALNDPAAEKWRELHAEWRTSTQPASQPTTQPATQPTTQPVSDEGPAPERETGRNDRDDERIRAKGVGQ